MRQAKLIFLFLSFFSLAAFSQVNLPYSINTRVRPTNTAPIATAVPYIDTTELFVSSGFQSTQIVPDFTLFDTLGNPTTLSTTLNQGKPVLLVSVSLSCPSSRHSLINVLPFIYSAYGNQINILLVYIVEAHPTSPDVSPYSNTVWTTSLNVQDSALVRQEVQYYQRKQECASLINRFNIQVPVLIDDTNNNYWSNFGPAPNNAYLIAPNGMVFSKYGWFDRSKMNLMDDIATLLLQTGISETTNNSSAEIFPNPSNGNSVLNVENEDNYNFRIIDMAGRIVADEEKVSSSVSDLEKYHLDAGVYSVIVQAHSGKTFSLRYIVE